MLSNIIITLALLFICAFFLSRYFILPRNIWLLFVAQPLVMAASPVIVFIGGILSTSMASDPSLATLPVTVMILGVACGAIPAAMLAKNKGRRFAIFTGYSCGLLATLTAMISALISNFELFVFSGLLFGISTSFIQQLRFAAIESIKDDKDIPTVLSILMLSGIFSAFLGPEIAVAAKDWLVSPHGYAGSFLVLAGLIVCAMIIMLSFKNTQIENNQEVGEAIPTGLTSRLPLQIFHKSVDTQVRFRYLFVRQNPFTCQNAFRSTERRCQLKRTFLYIQ